MDGKEKEIWSIGRNDLKTKYRLKIALARSIYKLCRQGFNQPGNLDFKRDVAKHIDEEKICLIFEKKIRNLTEASTKDNPLIAFVSYRIVDGEIIYFSGVVIAPLYQGKGIASDIMRLVTEEAKVKWVAARTQNPAMRESLRKAFKVISPKLSGEKPPENHRSQGEKIALMLKMSNYDKDAMIGRGTYGKSLYGKDEYPKLDDMVLNSAFRRMVRAEEGDSMIIIGERGG